ncbi:MAG: BMP family ABC transporter substrate-binding protein [Treponema sp.]|jgi:simple sugar transport system substrate-binding protein|nr:BMP family ABC transporter substrate-binding protein [Treponema sp.]
MKHGRFSLFILLQAVVLLVCGCTGRAAAGRTIGVFIPGVLSGSPVYEMLAAGVSRAAEEFTAPGAEVNVLVIEGGYNQAEWENKVTVMAASRSYDLIVSSNPSLPAIVSGVSEKFPDQYFLLLDGELAGNSRVYTLRYNQREQAYLAGSIAALETEALGGIPLVGLIAAQEYPVMNNVLLPGYRAGAQAINERFGVEFRLVGNWYDAVKAGELAADLIARGVKVILCISGGANEGVVQTAADLGAKVVWFDTNGYAVRPGTVVGSSVLYQDKAAYVLTARYLEGSLPFGTAEMAGVKEGYVDFIQDDPHYRAAVAPEVRSAQAAIVEQIRSGELDLSGK